MLLRFTTKNLFSFKNETEFNLFPNKTQNLKHHIVKHGEFEFLRFSAIYGANGSGKSNLVKAISLLDTIVEAGHVSILLDDHKFKLEKNNLAEPISLGVEFLINANVYFYTISFEKNKILYEYLAKSYKNRDELIFERELVDNKQTIKFHKDYYKSADDKIFAKVLAEKIIQSNELLITFLSQKYSKEFEVITEAFNWFQENLVVITPDTKANGIAIHLDKDPKLKEFANEFIASLNTGVSQIEVENQTLEEVFGDEAAKSVRSDLKNQLNNNSNPYFGFEHKITKEEIFVYYENDEFIVKRLVTKHQNSLGDLVLFKLEEESDGTKRLIDYILAIKEIINSEKVYVIDEIERSIHPITIKEIVSKLTLDEKVKGQLIFSTHESNLLDQNILRPDEIWFAQKDVDGASKIYSLSDFKIHNTINIENGYMKGRFGGIPFLGNLKELNW